MLWSDPDKDVAGWGENDRGVSRVTLEWGDDDGDGNDYDDDDDDNDDNDDNDKGRVELLLKGEILILLNSR